VRNFTRDTLEELGYNVLEAINGKKALELIEGNNLKIDLLISDLIMPEMNGKELAAEIKSLIPENKILFTSGYTDSHIVHSGTLEKGINFLQKPFSIQMLSEKVRTLLDSDS